MNDFDKRLKAMAGAELCPVPEGFEGRIKERLEKLGETRARKVRPARWVLIAACLCMVLVGTVAATGELGYNMWADYEHSFSDCEAAFRAQEYDVAIPERIEEYTFEYLQKLYVVPDGTPFLKAVNGSAVYRPMDITYRYYDDAYGTTRDLGVTMGKTDLEYWATYFSYDPVTLEFSPDEAWYETNEFTQTEYKGRTICLYSKKEAEIGEFSVQHATWVDRSLGTCFSVSLGLSGWPGDAADISTLPPECFPGDILPYVRQLIDHFE